MNVLLVEQKLTNFEYFDKNIYVPEELLIRIFSYISPLNIHLNCMLVDKNWNNVSNDTTLWKIFCLIFCK